MEKRRCTFWLDEDVVNGLKRLKDRDGIPEAEQVRRALRAWFDSKGLELELPKHASGKSKGAK